MKRSCLWLCTLTAATAAAISDARAFSPHGPATHGFARFIAGPELRGGPGGNGPPPNAIKPPVPPSGNYSFSGNSFNLSVTRNGRPQTPPSPPPSTAPSGERPGFFQRMFNWW
ncbi:MAG TPA: hypothetical protein VJN67_05305 [Stellaceae bacterium]|nr:hypothetical protein [Stellaceae bacterium]